MAFVVEDGSGKQDATAYITVAFMREFCEVHDLDLEDDTDADLERRIQQATLYMDTRYTFLGFRKVGRLQALEWPRYRAYYHDGSIAADVPIEVQRACAFLAFRARSARLAPDPVYDSSGARVLVKTDVVGPITEHREFAAGGSLAKFRAYPEADEQLRELVVQGRQVLRA